MATIGFDLVTPEQQLCALDATMVVVPGVEGDMGVKMRHSPLLTKLRTGFVVVFTADGEPQYYLVEGGFAEICENRCVVIAERAVAEAEMDLGSMESRVRELNDDLRVARDDLERASLTAQHAQAAALLSVAKAVPYR